MDKIYIVLRKSTDEEIGFTTSNEKFFGITMFSILNEEIEKQLLHKKVFNENNDKLLSLKKRLELLNEKDNQNDLNVETSKQIAIELDLKIVETMIS